MSPLPWEAQFKVWAHFNSLGSWQRLVSCALSALGYSLFSLSLGALPSAQVHSEGPVILSRTVLPLQLAGDSPGEECCESLSNEGVGEFLAA